MVLVMPHSYNCMLMLTMARWHEQDLVGGNLVHHEKNIIVRRIWLIGTWYWKRGGLLKKATVHRIIWNFNTSTPGYEYMDALTLRLGNCEDYTSTCDTILLSTKIWVEYSLIRHLCCVGNIGQLSSTLVVGATMIPWFRDPFFIFARGMKQCVISVSGIIQGDMCDEIGGYVHYYQIERLLWN